VAATGEVRHETRGWGRARKEAVTGWAFALPWLIGFLVFTAGPMLFSIYASFTRYPITRPAVWVGLENYERIFNDPWFYRSLYNTFWMVVVRIPIASISALALALLLSMDLPGGPFFRTIIYMPHVLSGVAAVFLWRWILQPNGLLNAALAWFGIRGPAWFFDPAWTKPGMVVMGLWWIGADVLIYLAGLKGIPDSLYEAATIDGAGGLAKTWYITLPLLTPTIFFQLVTSIIGTFQVFSTAYILSSGSGAAAMGGPRQSLLFYVLYLYNRAFGLTGAAGFQMGYASALAWILFAIIMIVTVIQLVFARRWVYYETGER
jgi:multiple sugar transport system permease protein